jgi:ATPase subunit of ABC transporter with duplicated ATPase domains
LDRAACKWLGDFLRASSGTVVIVSHDESLLETCNHIAEVRGSKLHHFTGSYTQFLSARKLREEQATAQAMAAQVEIARTEAYIGACAPSMRMRKISIPAHH